MKISNKQQMSFVMSTNIIHQILNLKDFMNLYKKCIAKPHSFLVIDATLASDENSCFKIF